MKCSKCFKENNPGVKFCAYCGSAMPALEFKSSSTSSSSRSVGNKTMISPVSPESTNYSSTEIVIGRDSGNDLALNDSTISGKHAKIFLENGNLFIEDLKSLNGTFVNGQKVQGRVRIKSSDQISLGTHILNKNHQILSGLFYRSESTGIFQDGSLRLTFNRNWVGKIIFFVLIILLMLPWVIISSKGGQFSFTALDLATNTLPGGLSIKSLNFPGYGNVHTIFLILFILTVIGLVMNFFKIAITEKLNLVNLLSLVLLIIMIIIAMSANSSMSFDNVLVDLVVGELNIRLSFAAYMFLLLSFISMFEGLIEYHISGN